MGFCSNDNRFQVGSDCRPLDFTLTFEQSYATSLQTRFMTDQSHFSRYSVLSIIPDALLILITLHRLRALRTWSVKVSRTWSLLFCLKALAGMVLLASSLAVLVVHAVTGPVRTMTRTTLPAFVIQSLACVRLHLHFLQLLMLGCR